MANRIGPSFSDELNAAGLLGLPFSWRESDGVLGLADDRLTDAQRAAIQAVLASHDPTKPSAEQLAKLAKQQALTDLLNHCTLIESDAALPVKVKRLATLLKKALTP